MESLHHGNMTEEETKSILQIINEKFSFNPLESDILEDRIVQLPKGKTSIFQTKVFNLEDHNSAVYNFYQIGPENLREDVLLDLFNQICKSEFFNQLRTKEQLGYM